MLIVQNDDGTIENANSYASLADFKAYLALRGVTVTATDTELEEALINATDYIDLRFEFVGIKANENQSTEIPRLIINDIALQYYTDTIYRNLKINSETKKACFEYALAYLQGGKNLFQTFDKNQSLIKKQASGVGPVSESIEFQNSSVSASKFPVYQRADNLMIKSGNIETDFNTWRI